MKKKQNLILSIIGILTLLVAIIGATFAYFSAIVTGNEEASSVTVTTATLGISYTNGNEIKMEKAMPGDESEEKSFTIASVGTMEQQPYTINWDIAQFSFEDKSDLLYSLRGESTADGTIVGPITNQPMPTSTGITDIGNGTLDPEEVHTYYLKVIFKYTEEDQNSNQTKTFHGKIKVTSPTVSEN